MTAVSDARFAIVSDIHGNLTALDAVIADISRRGVDRVVHGGDLALGGCQPAEVIDRIRELGWHGIVGNTDELLWRAAARKEQERRTPQLRELLNLLFDHYAPATRELLGDERLAWMSGLPHEHREAGLTVVHASPGDLWQAPSPDSPRSEFLDTYGRYRAQTVVYGHIHLPFHRDIDGMSVANSGSVGSPFDGDPRASYLLVEGGRVEIVRVEYDIEREGHLILQSGYPDAARIGDMRRAGKFLPLK